MSGKTIYARLLDARHHESDSSSTRADDRLVDGLVDGDGVLRQAAVQLLAALLNDEDFEADIFEFASELRSQGSSREELALAVTQLFFDSLDTAYEGCPVDDKPELSLLGDLRESVQALNARIGKLEIVIREQSFTQRAIQAICFPPGSSSWLDTMHVRDAIPPEALRCTFLHGGFADSLVQATAEGVLRERVRSSPVNLQASIYCPITAGMEVQPDLLYGSVDRCSDALHFALDALHIVSEHSKSILPKYLSFHTKSIKEIPTMNRTKGLKPGETAPNSGQYRQIGPRGGKGNEVTVPKGHQLPPAPVPGTTYVLVDRTKNKAGQGK